MCKKKCGLKTWFEQCINSVKDIFKKQSKTEKAFVNTWTEILKTNADVFNGLYTGLKKTSEGNLQKKKASILNEWRLRAHYRWEGKEIDEINNACLESITNESEDGEIIKWAKLLLSSVLAADIVYDDIDMLEIDEQNISAYSCMDGEDLFVGDVVNIKIPAWHQKGKTIEKGFCTKTKTDIN